MNLNEWVNNYITEISEDHSSDPNDKYVVRPCKNPKEPWAVWEGEVRVKGFATKEEAQAFADMKNKEQGLGESKVNEEDPCWDDYEMVGMKKKNGKEVPNCVPKKESVNEGIWPKSKLADRFEFILSDELKKNFKGLFYVDGYDLYHNDKKVMTINPDKDSANSIVKTLKSKIKESVNENFIPKVGTIDDFELKNLLLKNSKVKEILSDKEFNFLKKSDTDVIRHQSKRFNTIVTDGKFEFEIDLKSRKLIKPLSKARKEIVSYYSSNESVNEAKYNTKQDAMNAYMKGKVSAKELDKIAKNDFNSSVATKKELQNFLDSGYMKSLMANTYGLKVPAMEKKVKELMVFAEGTLKEATPEEEDEFHTKLDKLVHKTFGHSSDEEKMNEATPDQVIKDLDKAKNDLLKKVNVLIAKKKKLYSNVDIESPMSADEKKLNNDIADLFSQINKLVLQKRSIKKESTNESKIKMNALDWGKSTAERNANLDKYDSLKSDKEREAFLRKLKGESVNEGAEPDIITQLRDVVENGYNTLKDPKTGKKMKVDTYSASAVTQVYDALKQQSNKDKFVSNGLVGMVNLAFKILNKQEIVEYDVETLEELNDFHQFMKEYKSDINEAEYQGRKVKLGKIMQGDVKKFKVYVKNDKGNVVKVNFGQKGMNIKKDNPEARKSFRARHNCDNPGPRWKARYWSCRKW